MHNLQRCKRLHPFHILAHAEEDFPWSVESEYECYAAEDGRPEDGGGEVVEDEVECFPAGWDFFYGLRLGGCRGGALRVAWSVHCEGMVWERVVRWSVDLVYYVVVDGT